MLWLKTLDGAAKIFPRYLLRRLRLPAQSKSRPCIVRPGGLGDMVLVTRALLGLGINPKDVDWLAEKRNSIWLEYLGVDFLCYDSAETMLPSLAGLNRYPLVINTEQTFGLSALLSARMTESEGRLAGFDVNRRSDCYDLSVAYSRDEHELSSFTRLIQEANDLFGGFTRNRFQLPPIREGQASSHVVVALAGFQQAYKRLSVETWCALVRTASEADDLVYLLGAPQDREAAVRIQNSCGVKLRNLVGVAPFPRTVDLVRTASRLFSVDSGLVHVADFFGVPSSVVFQGGNPQKWHPTTEGSRVLNKRLEDISASTLAPS